MKKRYLLQAERIDKACPRGPIMLGDIFYEQRRYKQAIACYKRVSERDPDFIYAIMPAIIDCYKKLSDETGLSAYLERELTDKPQVDVVLAIAKQLNTKQGHLAALEFITKQLQNNPSLAILQYLVTAYRDNTHGEVHAQLSLLLSIIDSILKKRNLFRCNQCGFSGKSHYWLCPGCQTWNSTKPIQDL